MLCFAVEFLSYGPSTKQRSYQAGSVIKLQCCLQSEKQLLLKPCVISSFLTFESTITIMIKSIQNLSNKPEWALLTRDRRFDPGLVESVG